MTDMRSTPIGQRGRHGLLFCLAALWLVVLTPLFALNPARKADSYMITGWFTEHGLPSNKIRDVIQARDGHLWLATGQGIARFDGGHFTLFNSVSHPTLRGADFFSALEAPDGTLWFGGEAGLFRWRDGRFDHFTTEHGLAHNDVRALALARDGSVVACTRKGFSFVRDGRITTPGGVWKQIRGVTRSYLERADGSMLLGTSAGLWRIAGDEIEQLSGVGHLQGNGYFGLLETPDGSVWIGYSDGVLRLRPDGTSEHFGRAEGLVSPHVSDLRQDRDGNLWIAASGSLYRLANGRLEQAKYVDHFKGTPLHQLCEDREGGLWITTVTGLFRLKDTMATHIGAADGLTQTSVYSVYEAPDGAWWFGLWYGGVYRYDGKRAVRVPALAALDRDRIYSFTGEADGTLWIGAESGLYKYHQGVLTNLYSAEEETRRRKQMVERPDAPLPGPAHHWVNALASDGDGGHWVATDGALYHESAGKFRAYTTADGLAGNDIESVLHARNGDVWATAPGHGVVRRHDGRWTNYLSDKAFPSHRALAVFEDAAGSIWVTTDGDGLIRFKDGQWRTFTTRDGLADDYIGGMIEDELGFLWIAYPLGIMRIPRQEFDEVDAGKRALLQPRIFSHSDGLPRGEVVPAGKPNCWRTSDGRLLFGTDLGVAVIDPGKITINPLEPPVYIERLAIDGAGADLSRPATVPPGRRDVQIHYTAISLLAPEKVRFKIRLAPLDREWVNSGALREIRYAQLPPGAYTFQVKACNNDGVWNEQPATLAFTVSPYFHQTPWFMGLIAAAVLTTGAGIPWWRSRRARRQMAVLSGLVENRTRELQEAKDRAESAVLAKNDSIAALKRAQDELTEASALLEAMLENSPDFIYFKDCESRFVRFSRAVMRRFNRDDPSQLIGLTDSDVFSPEHAAPAYHDEQEIIRTGTPIVGKLEREKHTDGHVTWALTTKMPWRDGAGKIVGTFGISKDVTAWKNAEAKLADTHKQLLDTSRQAGMAEVATGVLHNVGNVLNSVNVSATLVVDRLRESKSANVPKLAALLQEHAADLGNFLTNDPKGRRIPAYLGTLSAELAAERKSIDEELGHLRKNIDHIKDIVAMQQSYAKVSGVSETVAISELVEDALRMNASALARHGLEVVHDHVDAPIVTTERHKVLQILVNLIRNAKYACDESGRPDKQLKVRITQHADRVRIAVIDNGVGIPAENLARIFAHGFTTRDSGHGFGLHSGALAAKELGGSLTAQSAGPGKGAVFTLELPLHRTPPSS